MGDLEQPLMQQDKSETAHGETKRRVLSLLRLCLYVIAAPFVVAFGIAVLMHGGLFGYILCRALGDLLRPSGSSSDPPHEDETPICSARSGRLPRMLRVVSRLRSAKD
jgi:hypothetical protein